MLFYSSSNQMVGHINMPNIMALSFPLYRKVIESTCDSPGNFSFTPIRRRRVNERITLFFQLNKELNYVSGTI